MENQLVKSNKFTYYIAWFLVGLLISYICFGSLSFLGVLIFAGITTFVIAPAMSDSVEPNYVGIFKNRQDNKQLIALSSGFYWFPTLAYIKIKDLDSTKNRYLVNDYKAETKNSITVTVKSASLWARIADGVRFYKTGDDVNIRVIEDWSDTVKGLIASYDDIELRKIQNDKKILRKIFGEGAHDDDTLKATLEDCGLEYSYISIGEIEIPDTIQKANQAEQEAQRRARGEDFDNIEKSKRINTIFIDLLLTKIKPPTSRTKILKEAMGNLGYTEDMVKGSHEKEFEVSDEGVSIAKSKATLKEGELEKLLKQAEEALNIREGRVQAYSGLGNANPIVNTSKK